MSEYIIECLKNGLEIEREGIKFYSGAAESIEDPKGKSTLNFLAKEEGRHLEYIKELIDSINASTDIGGIIQKGIPEIFPKKDEFASEIASTKGDKRILEEAMGVEERSIEFYTGCRDKVEGEEKDIFKALIKEEEKHKAWLDYMKDGMDVHGYWYDLGNFSFDGS